MIERSDCYETDISSFSGGDRAPAYSGSGRFTATGDGEEI